MQHEPAANSEHGHLETTVCIIKAGKGKAPVSKAQLQGSPKAVKGWVKQLSLPMQNAYLLDFLS